MTRSNYVTLGADIAARIEALIKERGLSYRKVSLQLAALRPGSTEAGWKKQLSRWRKGQIPELEQAELLAQVLGTNVTELRPAEVTQADYDRLMRAQEEHEAEQRRLREQLDREIANLRAEQRQPQELPKPGSRTRRNA